MRLVGCVAVSLLACLFVPCLALAAWSDPKMAPLAAALQQARGTTQSVQLELELESLRQQSVQPAARLLLRRAQRDIVAGDHRACLSDLDDATSLQPDNALLWREHAGARAALGDLDGAVDDLGVALSRDPDDVLAWRSLAGIEEARTSWMSAFKAWQHVVSLDPHAPDAAARLDRLRRKAFGQPA